MISNDARGHLFPNSFVCVCYMHDYTHTIHINVTVNFEDYAVSFLNFKQMLSKSKDFFFSHNFSIKHYLLYCITSFSHKVFSSKANFFKVLKGKRPPYSKENSVIIILNRKRNVAILIIQ